MLDTPPSLHPKSRSACWYIRLFIFQNKGSDEVDFTEKALEQIRAEWIAQGSPAPTSIAKRADMPSITVRRYLDGSTKRGDPARVRAIALALGRKDIAESVKDTVSADLSESIMRFMSEKFLLWRESNLEELNRERAMREESEKRYASEIERIITSKDKSIELLRARIAQLENDKERQATVNASLKADKEQINTEMLYCRKAKRKYEVFCVVMLISIIAYISIFDLPNPSNGITYLLSTVFG